MIASPSGRAPRPTTPSVRASRRGGSNGDGYRDLAIGVYGEILSGHPYAGAEVLYGSASGLSGKGARWITRSTPGIPGAPREDDGFGDTVRLRGSSAGVGTRGATTVDGAVIQGMLRWLLDP
ncbi:hypothetical protein SAMN05216532_7371 [Streptomyces sp. 2231.1]|nr:hypothetical protein SAMN05216532_7371 [Streptomyces sp. 2231.1]